MGCECAIQKREGWPELSVICESSLGRGRGDTKLRGGTLREISVKKACQEELVLSWLVSTGSTLQDSGMFSGSQVCKERHRFEKLMEYFRNEDSNIDFMVRSTSWHLHYMKTRVCSFCLWWADTKRKQND